MNLKNLIAKNRSYRRFNQNKSISTETLTELIDLARLSASARNQQSLKYIICNSPELNKLVFPTLGWAGYLSDWDGPTEGERPSAYIICLHDKSIADSHFCDEGIAAQSILLGATEQGLGGCIIWSVNREQLRRDLHIDEKFKIIQVIALGKPIEEICIEEMKNNDIKYWRDSEMVHHVPKRSLNDIIIDIKKALP